MDTKKKKTKLEFSWIPNIFASGCCSIRPFVFIFFLSLSEMAFPLYVYWIRLFALFSLAVVLYNFFRRKKVKLDFYSDLKIGEKNMLCVIIVQAYLYMTMIYFFFVLFVAPEIWSNIVQQNIY